MAFTLSQLRIFQAVVEHGSLRAAARALDLAQSGVTQQLQSLEATLGATLFTRTNRGIVPTAVGQRLLARSGSILGECEQVEREIRQLSGAYEGTVTLGLVAEPLIDAFAPVLSAFRARFDKVDVHLRTGTSRMMIGWLRKARSISRSRSSRSKPTRPISRSRRCVRPRRWSCAATGIRRCMRNRSPNWPTTHGCRHARRT